MFRHLTLAAVTIAAMTALPVPAVIGTAQAQQCRPGATHCVPTQGTSTYRCSDQLGYLRRVYVEQIESIEDVNRVSIVPICLDDYGLMRSDGNAGALREAIADNDAITEALFLKNFGPDDVVGIRMTDDDAGIFFVHPLHNM